MKDVYRQMQAKSFAGISDMIGKRKQFFRYCSRAGTVSFLSAVAVSCRFHIDKVY